MSEPKLPTTSSVQEALDAFEAMWEFVAKKDRAELIRERNDVRRILVMVLNYVKAASERPTLNAALPEDAAASGGEPDGSTEPPPKRSRPRGMQVDGDESEEETKERLAPLRRIVDLILALEIEQRETLFDILEMRFCFDCGEAFGSERESRRHRCVFEDEEDDEDDDDDGGDEDEDDGGDEDESDDEPAAEIASERDA